MGNTILVLRQRKLMFEESIELATLLHLLLFSVLQVKPNFWNNDRITIVSCHELTLKSN